MDPNETVLFQTGIGRHAKMFGYWTSGGHGRNMGNRSVHCISPTVIGACEVSALNRASH